MLRKLALNPAVTLYVANALIAMAVAWGWHASQEEIGALDTIVTGCITLFTVFTVRPIVIPSAAAAVTTVLTAFGAFHLHISPNVLSTTVAVASILMGFLLHQSVVPVVAARKGTTAQAILLSGPRPGSQ